MRSHFHRPSTWMVVTGMPSLAIVHAEPMRRPWEQPVAASVGAQSPDDLLPRDKGPVGVNEQGVGRRDCHGPTLDQVRGQGRDGAAHIPWEGEEVDGAPRVVRVRLGVAEPDGVATRAGVPRDVRQG